MKNVIKLILFLFFICVSSFLFSDNDVLLLNSYHKGFLWSDEITTGVEESLNNIPNIELHIDYLDSKRQFDLEYVELLKSVLLYKYKKHNYGVIITTDDNAFNFAIENRESLFDNIPIVFSGLNYGSRERLEQIPNITGINEKPSIKSNIDIIKQNHPNNRKIIIITDNTTTGKKIQKEVREKINSFFYMDIELIYDFTHKELKEYVQNIDNGVILFTFFFRDNLGEYYDNKKLLPELVELSSVPIYGILDYTLNYGIVGGDLIDGYQQGFLAGEKCLQILDGIEADNIPIIYDSPTKIIYNYKQLKKFNININTIAKGEIINMPSSFYRENIVLVWFVLVTFLLLLVALFSFLYAYIKTKRANNKLDSYKNHLEEIVDERTEALRTSLNNLENARDQLVQTEKLAALGRLISGVAHELNTPLGIGVTATSYICEQVAYLKDSIINNKLTQLELNEYVDSAIESSTLLEKNLSKAVDIIETFKRLSVNSEQENSQKINIKTYINELIVSLYSNRILETQDIVVLCPDNIFIDIYPVVLTQILVGLISNSLEHGIKDKKDGKITISVSKINKTIELVVSDNGVGIPKVQLNKIFDPFFMVNRKTGHYGLGINIVYNLVTEKLKGTLTCTSIENVETTFNIKFPIV